jgi:hypothetical protein
MSGDRTIAARAGEYFREASVLILVFGILDPMVQSDAVADPSLVARLQKVSFEWGLAVSVTSVLLFLGGVALDYLRTRGTVED